MVCAAISLPRTRYAANDPGSERHEASVRQVEGRPPAGPAQVAPACASIDSANRRSAPGFANWAEVSVYLSGPSEGVKPCRYRYIARGSSSVAAARTIGHGMRG